MSVGVVDSGVAIGWITRKHRSLAKLDELFAACRRRNVRIVLSLVNLAEILKHMATGAREVGHDPVELLRASGVEFHAPDEWVVRRVARLPTSLADGFAAATALALSGRLHTTDRELIDQLRPLRVPTTHY